MEGLALRVRLALGSTGSLHCIPGFRQLRRLQLVALSLDLDLFLVGRLTRSFGSRQVRLLSTALAAQVHLLSLGLLLLSPRTLHQRLRICFRDRCGGFPHDGLSAQRGRLGLGLPCGAHRLPRSWQLTKHCLDGRLHSLHLVHPHRPLLRLLQGLGKPHASLHEVLQLPEHRLPRRLHALQSLRHQLVQAVSILITAWLHVAHLLFQGLILSLSEGIVLNGGLQLVQGLLSFLQPVRSSIRCAVAVRRSALVDDA
mmetsp:Transcript_25661/g.59591  ORF Transcript_25661/g.59591 Transcript_25661/m.59591 type:complete len:255 (-) Transcript_25661:2444-3208(-)